MKKCKDPRDFTFGQCLIFLGIPTGVFFYSFVYQFGWRGFLCVLALIVLLGLYLRFADKFFKKGIKMCPPPHPRDTPAPTGHLPKHPQNYRGVRIYDTRS